MASCKDCLHVEVCREYVMGLAAVRGVELNEAEIEQVLVSDDCDQFSNRSRFVELPCKVGDTAWIIVRCKNGKDYFYTGIVTGVHVTDRKTIYKLPCKRFNYIVIRFLQTDSLKRINFNEIGKTVFFTKEAAEQALKEREK